MPKSSPPHPAFLWIAPYGRESRLPDEYGVRDGFVSLFVNLLGESAFHQEKYTASRGYFAEGIASPATSIFRVLVSRCLASINALSRMVEVDEQRIATMGLSQGGGLALISGRLSPFVQSICAELPFLSDIVSTLQSPIYRYPLKEIVDDAETRGAKLSESVKTLAYFDTAVHASYCNKPTHVSLGLRDPACKPATVRKLYNALEGEKALLELDWGHDWHPEMITANAEWMERTLYP